jgi:hypothetical protein
MDKIIKNSKKIIDRNIETLQEIDLGIKIEEMILEKENHLETIEIIKIIKINITNQTQETQIKDIDINLILKEMINSKEIKETQEETNTNNKIKIINFQLTKNTANFIMEI